MQQITKNDSISQIIDQIGDRAKIVDKNNNESLLKKGLIHKPVVQESNPNTTDLPAQTLIKPNESQPQPGLKANIQTNTVPKNATTTSDKNIKPKPSISNITESDSKLNEDNTNTENSISAQDVQKAANFYKDNKETVDKAAKIAYQNREAIAEGAKATGNVVKKSQILKEGTGQAKTSSNPLQSLFGFK